jgi:hypothetical protein
MLPALLHPRSAGGIIGFLGYTVALLALTAPPSIASEQLYLITGLEKYSPYPRAQLKLDMGSKQISGSLFPLLGDRTAPVNVSGRMMGKGRLSLEFHFPDGPQTIVFRSNDDKKSLRWNSSVKTQIRDETVNFFRYRTGSFSDAALTLYQVYCGAAYGTLDVRLSNGATKERLQEFISSKAEISEMTFDYTIDNNGDRQRMSGPLLSALLTMLNHQRDSSFILEVNAPPGDDAFIARALRSSDLFSSVNTRDGGCDPADQSYFVVDRALFFDNGNFSEAKFQAYLDGRLERFAGQLVNGHPKHWRESDKVLSRSVIPPLNLIYRARLYIASEITRGQPAMWDSFSVFFAPGEIPSIKDTEYAVILTVDRGKTVRRSSGNDNPPDDSYFKEELTSGQEASVTTNLARFLARLDKGWCFFDSEEIADAIAKRCLNSTPDDSAYNYSTASH